MHAIMSIFSRRPPPPPPVTTAPAPPAKSEEAANRVRKFQEAVSQGSEVAGRLDKMLSEADPFENFANEIKGRARKRGKGR